MPVRFLSDAELARLSSWPDEIADEDLVTFFTLTGDDLVWLRTTVRAENRLGAAGIVCSAVAGLDSGLDDLRPCPEAAVRRLAEHLRLAADEECWAGRRATAVGRAALGVITGCGCSTGSGGEPWAWATASSSRRSFSLGRWNTTPWRAACAGLRLAAQRADRPPIGGHAVAAGGGCPRRRPCRDLSPARVASGSAAPCSLDGLLDVDEDLGMTRLAWLRRGATAATPEVLEAELAKLEFDVPTVRTGWTCPRCRRVAAGCWPRLVGGPPTRRCSAPTPIAGTRSSPATLAETYVEVLDELVQLLDQALAGADSRARHELSQRVVERAKVEIDRGRLLDEVLDVLADPGVSDADAGRLVRARVGMARLQAARRPADEREPRDHGHFDLLAARYKYLRTFTLAVIASLPLTGNTASAEVAALLAAVEVLRELNGSGRTSVPDSATSEAATSFVPAGAATRPDGGAGRGATDRHYWELAVLYGCRPGCVPGTCGTRLPPLHRPDHAADPGSKMRVAQREDFCAVTGSDRIRCQLQRLENEWTPAAVADLEQRVLHPSGQRGGWLVGEDGDLDRVCRSSPHSPHRPPSRRRVAHISHFPSSLMHPFHRQFPSTYPSSLPCGSLPQIPHLPGFHLSLRLQPPVAARPISSRAHSSHSFNLTSPWRRRAPQSPSPQPHAPPRPRPASRAASPPPRASPHGAPSRYFLDEGTTTYTHVSDQHSTYGTKIIPTTWREAVAVLDEIFGNPTDLPIAEHTTDTAGQTLATFAIFDLAGLQFSPRIRDIGRLQLYRLGAGSSWRSRYPHAGPLLTQPIQTVIAEHWNDLLRLVGSMKFGTRPRACSSPSCTPGAANTPRAGVAGIRPAGAHHLPVSRRRRRGTAAAGRRQLNKGESLHALRRDLFFAHQRTASSTTRSTRRCA